MGPAGLALVLCVWKQLERATGVEPATSSLGSWHSTTELRPLCRESRSLLPECQFSTRRRGGAGPRASGVADRKRHH
jgi:hypothetical protein